VTNPRPYSSINLHTSKQAAAWTDKQKKDGDDEDNDGGDEDDGHDGL
jgi:hypothetical protein